MGLGLAVSWAGYTLAYFGFCSLRGEGVGLLDLVIPGRTVTIPTSGGGAGAAFVPGPQQQPGNPAIPKNPAPQPQPNTPNPVGVGGGPA